MFRLIRWFFRILWKITKILFLVGVLELLLSSKSHKKRIKIRR